MLNFPNVVNDAASDEFGSSPQNKYNFTHT